MKNARVALSWIGLLVISTVFTIALAQDNYSYEPWLPGGEYAEVWQEYGGYIGGAIGSIWDAEFPFSSTIGGTAGEMTGYAAGEVYNNWEQGVIQRNTSNVWEYGNYDPGFWYDLFNVPCYGICSVR
jgi:hypothetical protein